MLKPPPRRIWRRSAGFCHKHGNSHGFCQSTLKLNDKDYFETHGFNVLVFENQYNGIFFDEKTAGILLIHHSV